MVAPCVILPLVALWGNDWDDGWAWGLMPKLLNNGGVEHPDIPLGCSLQWQVLRWWLGSDLILRLDSTLLHCPGDSRKAEKRGAGPLMAWRKPQLCREAGAGGGGLGAQVGLQ